MLIEAYCLIVIGYTWDLTLTTGKYIWLYLYVLFWSILAWLLHVDVVAWLLHGCYMVVTCKIAGEEGSEIVFNIESL